MTIIFLKLLPNNNKYKNYDNSNTNYSSTRNNRHLTESYTVFKNICALRIENNKCVQMCEFDIYLRLNDCGFQCEVLETSKYF